MQIQAPPRVRAAAKPTSARRGLVMDLIDLADTVTRMTLIKHHYMAGVAMQRGIED